MTTQEHILYSPDLAATDFYMFPSLKSALKGRNFVMLPTLLRMRRKTWKSFHTGFQKCSQPLYSRRQKCAVAQGDYFEGNVA